MTGMWRPHGDNVETTWGQHGDHGDVETTWAQWVGSGQITITIE